MFASSLRSANGSSAGRTDQFVMNDRVENNFLSLTLFPLPYHLLPRHLPTLLPIKPRSTDIYIIRKTSTLIPTLNSTKSFQPVIQRCRLVALRIPRSIVSHIQVTLTMLATGHLTPGTNFPQSIANRALIILFTCGGAEYLALAFVVVTLVNTLFCYFSLLDG